MRTTMLTGVLLASALIVVSTQTFVDEFNTDADRLDRAVWTTEIGLGSYLGRTQLRDWVTEGDVGRFLVRDGVARLALDTFNPTGFSLYGTHAKSRATFQPTATTDIVLAVRMRLSTLQPGLVYGVYFYGCGPMCGDDHDEIDIELVTNFLQGGRSHRVQLNRYAAEPLGEGHGPVVDLPAGFDPLAYHEWKIRWGLSRITYFVDNVTLFTATTAVPQRPMHADIIAWGPDSGWAAAYDASLQPTGSSAANQSFAALVDRFAVRTVSAFTDSVLIPAATVIRVVHMRELREHVDALRAREGLAPFQWTDANAAAGTTTVQARHIVDLRTAIAAVYSALGLPAPGYTDSALAAGMTMKALHIDELRAAVMALE